MNNIAIFGYCFADVALNNRRRLCDLSSKGGEEAASVAKITIASGEEKAFLPSIADYGIRGQLYEI